MAEFTTLVMPSGGIQPVRTGSIEPSHEILFDQRTGQHCRLNLYHYLKQNRVKKKTFVTEPAYKTFESHHWLCPS